MPDNALAMQSYLDRFSGALRSARDTVLNNVEITTAGKLYCSYYSIYIVFVDKLSIASSTVRIAEVTVQGFNDLFCPYKHKSCFIIKLLGYHRHTEFSF